MNLKRFLLISLTLLLLSGCGKTPGNLYQRQLFAFGTIVDITIRGVDDDRASRAVQKIDHMYQAQHRDWHAWQRGELTDLNRAIADGKSVDVSPSMVMLIQLGQQFEHRSSGLFNPAIGHLLALWGFQQDEPTSRPPPNADQLEKLVADKPSILDLHIDGQRITSKNKSVKLDFGGFAKGYSIAKAVDLLEQEGIHHFIVNAGGDLCVRGKNAERAWRIGIQNPTHSGVLATLKLKHDTCVFTSGNYERFYEYQGKRYHHIIDPRSGYPASSSASVTVLSKDPTLADAAATAIFVAGPAGWKKIAESMSIQDVLLVTDAGEIIASPSMQPRIHLDPKP